MKRGSSCPQEAVEETEPCKHKDRQVNHLLLTSKDRNTSASNFKVPLQIEEIQGKMRGYCRLGCGEAPWLGRGDVIGVSFSGLAL